MSQHLGQAVDLRRYDTRALSVSTGQHSVSTSVRRLTCENAEIDGQSANTAPRRAKPQDRAVWGICTRLGQQREETAMGWTRMSNDEFHESAVRGLRSLHAQGKVTDEEMADQERWWAAGGHKDEGETSTWIAE